MSVQAMKGGAIEFLTKPFRDQDLGSEALHESTGFKSYRPPARWEGATLDFAYHRSSRAPLGLHHRRGQGASAYSSR
jgi:hypothetical protein